MVTRQELRKQLAQKILDSWHNNTDPYSISAANIAIDFATQMFMDAWQLQNGYAHELEDGIRFAKERGLNPPSIQSMLLNQSTKND